MTQKEITNIREKLKHIANDYWLDNTFLQWEWWTLVGLTIIPWIVWWKFIDRDRLFEILTYGFSVTVITVILDDLGSAMVWWTYPHEIIAVLPPLVPVDCPV